ncbi:AAA family ATPase [Phenylobacterium soli]|uniref:Response regulator receiver protein n=1 Tax=Phenylobacterium soli TaxID=2170551 RepID=A0A328ANP6_9CAUL|nr:AAA family ATPase [Phenylobacterium soli]RAK55931.1 response regulator receiver protein [Phenylobacterium soli]
MADQLQYGSAEAHTPRVVAYIRDDDSAGVVRQALSDLGAADTVIKTGGVATALTDATEHTSGRLLIVDVSGEDDPGARIRELANMIEPSMAILAVGETNDIRLYRNIREAGAVEYFFKPLVTALVARTCQAVLSGEAEAPQSRTGRTVFVVGVRGGVGATTVAVRTALRLSENPPRPVLAVDLDLQSGDAALQLDATPNHALTEALSQADRVDDLFLERGLIHATKRLDLMAALEPLDAQTGYDESALIALLDKVSRRYRYVVVDVPAAQAASLSRTLHMPSTLLLVSDARLVSAREVARWREWLGGNTAERTILHVLNMNGAPGSLPLAEFTRAADQAPDVVIPWAKDVASGALLGVKAKPEIPTLDRGLEPVLAMLSGDVGNHKKSLFERVLG